MRYHRHKKYLKGPSVVGFWGMFESDFGDPKTNSPYCRITPSSLGGVALPFRCPRCNEVLDQFSDSKTREKYHDTREVTAKTGDGRTALVRRNNYWCPYCGYRFYLSSTPMQLTTPLPPGAVAPSSVECFDDRGAHEGTRTQDEPSIFLIGVGAFGSVGGLFSRLFSHHRAGVKVLGVLA